MNLNRTDITIFFILFFLSVVLISFTHYNRISNLRPDFSNIISPAQKLLSRFSSNSAFWFEAIYNIRTLKIENEILIKKNLELQAQLIKISQLEEENDLLRIQLNMSSLVGQKLSGADIISRDYQNSRSFIIDRGSENGINSGMIVVGDGRNIVGQIIWTGKTTAQVRTIFDIATKISAQTQKSKIRGLVQGQGSNLIFNLVPKSREFQVGELVLSSGQDSIWPHNLIVGKVSAVDLDSNKIFKTASLESLIDWSKLDKVFIINSK